MSQVTVITQGKIVDGGLMRNMREGSDDVLHSISQQNLQNMQNQTIKSHVRICTVSRRITL